MSIRATAENPQTRLKFLPVLPTAFSGILFWILIIFTSLSQAETSTKIRSLNGVTQVQVKDSLTVDIEQASTAEIKITGDEDLVGKIGVTVDGDTVSLNWLEEPLVFFVSDKDFSIKVRLPVIQGISVLGSGDVSVEEANGPELDLSIKGSGDIAVDRANVRSLNCAVMGSGDISVKELAALDVELAIAGSGDISLSGVAVNLEASVLGSGDMNGEKFAVQKADVFIAGSGGVVLQSVEEKNVSSVGFGSFEVLSAGE